MGRHDWSYGNDIAATQRLAVPHADKFKTLKNIKVEVELGFDAELAYKEAARCLNCDVQTVFTEDLCIECDACVDICPEDCITFTENGDEADLRGRLLAPAQNLDQPLYVSDPVATGRIMGKDEDVSPTSTAPARPAPTAWWRGHCSAWACRWARRTSSRPTSRGCPPGSRSASARPATPAGAAAST
jgi:ferredoxin